MKGDFSRQTFDKTKHYAGVLMQQGRVQVDADWNEQQAIHQNRAATEAVDVIGPCGVPNDNPGFGLQLTPDGNDLFISPGRLYVDGILCELDATPVAVEQFPADNQVQVASVITDNSAFGPDQWVEIFAGNKTADSPQPVRTQISNVDRTTRLITLARTLTAFPQGSAPQLRRLTTVRTQPDLPGFSVPASGVYLAYLDVWLRHLTALDDPLIRETALGGPDTSTRAKVICQVKLLPLSSVSDDDPLLVADTALPEWDALTQRSSGTLNARAQPLATTDSTRDLLLPPGVGYQRLENQLYRVEIHNGGDFNTATFKWSRDNGSVVSAIELDANGKPNITENRVVVQNAGPDDVLGFGDGQWVEIIDDALDLNGTSQKLFQIEVNGVNDRTITLKPPAPSVPNGLHPKLRRWDQSGAAATENGVAITEGFQALEGGIEVTFSKGTYKTGDYWLIPARTATGEIEWPPFAIPNKNPIAQPPLGIQHHYCRLALLELSEARWKLFHDCREVFDALAGDLRVKRVIAKNAYGQEFVLHDGAVLEGDALAQGLRVALNQEIDPRGIDRAVCSVSVELPHCVETLLVGSQPIILAAGVDVDKSGFLNWVPDSGARTFLSTRLRRKVIGERRFSRDWDIVPDTDLAVTWNYEGGDVLAEASTAFTALPNISISKKPLSGDAVEINYSVSTPGGIRERELIGLVFNYHSPEDYCLMKFSFSGFANRSGDGIVLQLSVERCVRWRVAQGVADNLDRLDLQGRSRPSRSNPQRRTREPRDSRQYPKPRPNGHGDVRSRPRRRAGRGG
jgi:hypothetical protein